MCICICVCMFIYTSPFCTLHTLSLFHSLILAMFISPLSISSVFSSRCFFIASHFFSLSLFISPTFFTYHKYVHVFQDLYIFNHTRTHDKCATKFLTTTKKNNRTKNKYTRIFFQHHQNILNV